MTEKAECCLAVAAVGIAVLILFWAFAAFAHDHEHPELTDWYRSLHAKGGAWCCTGDDVDTVEEWKTDRGHYSARVEGVWIDIPDEALIEGPNRAGQAKIWLKHTNGDPEARCFIPGALG